MTHYTGKKQTGSAFYSFKSCSKTVSGHKQKCQIYLSPETLSKIWIIFTFLKVGAFLSILVVLYVTIEEQLSLGHRVSCRKN